MLMAVSDLNDFAGKSSQNIRNRLSETPFRNFTKHWPFAQPERYVAKDARNDAGHDLPTAIPSLPNTSLNSLGVFHSCCLAAPKSL
jgi:hypothetical protein